MKSNSTKIKIDGALLEIKSTNSDVRTILAKMFKEQKLFKLNYDSEDVVKKNKTQFSFDGYANRRLLSEIADLKITKLITSKKELNILKNETWIIDICYHEIFEDCSYIIPNTVRLTHEKGESLDALFVEQTFKKDKWTLKGLAMCTGVELDNLSEIFCSNYKEHLSAKEISKQLEELADYLGVSKKELVKELKHQSEE